jgi:hypothetical protein
MDAEHRLAAASDNCDPAIRQPAIRQEDAMAVIVASALGETVVI